MVATKVGDTECRYRFFLVCRIASLSMLFARVVVHTDGIVPSFGKAYVRKHEAGTCILAFVASTISGNLVPALQDGVAWEYLHQADIQTAKQFHVHVYLLKCKELYGFNFILI